MAAYNHHLFDVDKRSAERKEQGEDFNSVFIRDTGLSPLTKCQGEFNQLHK